MTEAEAVAGALGVALPQPMEKRIESRWLHVSTGCRCCKTSRGRPLEIDVLACSIAEMRSLVGLTTPTIDMVLDRARL